MSYRGFLFFPAVALAAAAGSAQTIERISVADNGAQANGPSDAMTRASADGRYVVFSSVASNLYPGDTVATRDAILRDRVAGTTTFVAPEAASVDLSVAGDLFSYTEFTIVGGSVQAFAHLVDMTTGIDVQLTGPETSFAGPISDDGRFMAYARDPMQASLPRIVVRRELASGVEDVASLDMGGTPSLAGFTLVGAISFDGSLVTFTSDAADLVPNDTNANRDAFYRDFGFGFTDRFSVTDTSAQIPGLSFAGASTPDTRFLLFSSTADGVVQGDANGRADVFTYDRFFSAVAIVSVASNEAFANGDSTVSGAWISPDGERIVFQSSASNLVAGDTNGASDVFERDVLTGETSRIVMGVGGAQPNSGIVLRGVSIDGRYLSITSTATNLVAGDTNGVADAFLVDRGPQCTVIPYCTALPNSTGLPATISSTGTPSFSLNNFVLSSLDLPPSAVCLFFHGTTRIDPPTPFGNGLRCVGGTIKRLGTLVASSGSVIQHQDLSSPPYSTVNPGDVRRFQLLYRDPAAGGAQFNTTSALEVAFCP